jgi:transcriptional regulator GlxA family with amidase domain
MHSVALAVSDGIPLLEIAVVCDIFGVDRSDLDRPWYEFRVCGSNTDHVGGWFCPHTPRALDELVAADTVIVPPCRDVEAPPPHDLVAAVRAAHERGARIVSICSGAFVLAAAGLLDRRRATTHWLYAKLLATKYPKVRVDPNVLYVDEGSILTSAGKVAGIDLCLHIVNMDRGAAVANALARRLVMPPHRDGGQAQFINGPPAGADDDVLGALQHWVAARLDEPLTVTDLARQANMSTRSLTRRFNVTVGITPLQWLLSQRMRWAQELLETTNHGIEQVAAQAGMGTGATLRRHFHRVLGVSPDTYRRTFRASSSRAASGAAQS